MKSSLLNRQFSNNEVYYRLIALWVLCEAMLGGIIHGFKIPVSGLVVGSCAVACICLIAWHVPKKGSIIKATLIVAIFKMMLSPQAPPPAYIAVFFQGLLGELLFWKRRYYLLCCMTLAVLALLESGLQRILVLTIVYGNDLWKVINDFINGLTKQKQATNYSLWIGGGYVALHLLAGVVVGWWAARLNRVNKAFIIKHDLVLKGDGLKQGRKKKVKIGLLLVWALLMGLYAQSYFHIGKPLLPSHISLKIFLRSLIIVLGWMFIVSPLLTKALHGWLRKKQGQSQREVSEVLQLLPAVSALLAESWRMSATQKGLKRITLFSRVVMANLLSPTIDPSKEVYILTGPIQSGKTTSLLRWIEGRRNTYGILTPVEKSKRIFLDVHSGEKFAMEGGTGEDVIAVGRFVFSRNGFEKAAGIIRNSLDKEGWLVIDEIGPLEWSGEGFAAVLYEALAEPHGALLLVVREGLVDKIKEQFFIPQAKMIRTLEELPQVASENVALAPAGYAEQDRFLRNT